MIRSIWVDYMSRIYWWILTWTWSKQREVFKLWLQEVRTQEQLFKPILSVYSCKCNKILSWFISSEKSFITSSSFVYFNLLYYPFLPTILFLKVFWWKRCWEERFGFFSESDIHPSRRYPHILVLYQDIWYSCILIY